MQKKWKQTGAALLIAGLTVSGTSYALADEKTTEPIDLSQLGKESTTDAVKDVPVVIPQKEIVPVQTKTDVKKETEEGKETVVVSTELPKIPEGYKAGNLAALAKAYEKVQNPTAKASIKRNMERIIAKWEKAQQVVEAPTKPVENAKVPVEKKVVKVEAEVQKKAPVTKEKAVKQENPTTVTKTKSTQADLNVKHKEQRQALKLTQKAEREALKVERKAAHETAKVERKAEHEALKVERKAEHEALKVERKAEKVIQKNEKKEAKKQQKKDEKN